MIPIDDFEMLANDDGDVLLSFNLQRSQPDSPQFYFEDSALILTRQAGQSFFFSDVEARFKDAILQKKEIVIAEMDNSGAALDYTALLQSNHA